MIMRYGPCKGLRLFKIGRYACDIWYAPSYYSVQEHTHPNSDGKFWVIYGRDRLIYKYRADNLVNRIQYILRWPSCMLHVLNVRHNERHGFMSGSTCMIWFCFQTWKPDSEVTNIIDDFVIS